MVSRVRLLRRIRAESASGELYKRRNGKWAFRVKASNGQIVATDGGQGYVSKSDARRTLEKVMGGEFDGPIEVVG